LSFKNETKASRADKDNPGEGAGDAADEEEEEEEEEEEGSDT